MREDDEPIPPGVDPEMWAAASPRMREILKAQAANQPYQAPQGISQQPVTYQAASQPVHRAAKAITPDPSTLSRTHNLVADNLQLAMSPAGMKTYPFYWSRKENRAVRNPYYTG